MIKSMEQALDIQSLRVAQGKRGYSRNVRRFLKKRHTDAKGNFSWHGYNESKQLLPHLAIIPEPEPPEPNGNVIEEVTPKKPRKARKPKQVEQVFDPSC